MRHRVSLGGTITAKWGIRFNPLLTANSGPPFDVTSGRDLWGTTIFNARPGIGTDPNKPGVVQTPYGLLDPKSRRQPDDDSSQFRSRTRSNHAEYASRQDLHFWRRAGKRRRFNRRRAGG